MANKLINQLNPAALPIIDSDQILVSRNGVDITVGTMGSMKAAFFATGTGIQDLLFTDDSGIVFIYRDDGQTPPVFTPYKLDGTTYVVGANPVPATKVTTIPLPVGAATATNQFASTTALNSIIAQQATAANQVTNGATLTSILGQQATAANQAALSAKFPVSLGQHTGATSLSVVPNLDVAFPVTPTGYVVTQTLVAVTATSVQLVPANPLRKYLSWMVVGTADVTVAAGATAAVVGMGLVYQSSGVGNQGASQEFPSGAPVNAFQAIAAAAGSTMIVWEGV